MEEFLKISFGNTSLPYITIKTITSYSLYFQIYMLIISVIKIFILYCDEDIFEVKNLFPMIKEMFLFTLVLISSHCVKNNIFPIIIFFIFF